MNVLVIASEPISADRLRAALGGASDDAEIKRAATRSGRGRTAPWIRLSRTEID